MHRLIAALVIFTILLSGCVAPSSQLAVTTADSESSNKSQPALQKLKVTLLCCYLSDAAFLIAQERGYFADRGLGIEVIRFTSAADGMAALLSGQVDVLGGALAPSVFNAIARGETLKVVADKGQSAVDCDYTSTAVRTADLEKWKAGDPAELRGSKAAASGTQTGSFYVDMMLGTMGMSLEDFEVVEVPATNRGEALVTGGVDLALLSEPWITSALDTGQVSLFMPAREVGSSVQLSVWIFGDSLLNENKALGQQFINAYMMGLRDYEEGKTASNIEVLAAGTGLEPGLVERVCWPKLSPDGRVNLEYIELYQDWLLSNGWLDQRLAPDQYWDGSFAQQAVQDLESEGQ